MCRLRRKIRRVFISNCWHFHNFSVCFRRVAGGEVPRAWRRIGKWAESWNWEIGLLSFSFCFSSLLLYFYSFRAIFGSCEQVPEAFPFSRCWLTIAHLPILRQARGTSPLAILRKHMLKTWKCVHLLMKTRRIFLRRRHIFSTGSSRVVEGPSDAFQKIQIFLSEATALKLQYFRNPREKVNQNIKFLWFSSNYRRKMIFWIFKVLRFRISWVGQFCS